MSNRPWRRPSGSTISFGETMSRKNGKNHSGTLRIPAIEVQQSPGRLLYSFAIDGKQIPTFATVSRIRRNGTELEGYQRPEVLSHIAEIRSYLESPSPMVPNAVVVAFDSRVAFEPNAHQATTCGYARVGMLVIP